MACPKMQIYISISKIDIRYKLLSAYYSDWRYGSGFQFIHVWMNGKVLYSWTGLYYKIACMLFKNVLKIVLTIKKTNINPLIGDFSMLDIKLQLLHAAVGGYIHDRFQPLQFGKQNRYFEKCLFGRPITFRHVAELIFLTLSDKATAFLSIGDSSSTIKPALRNTTSKCSNSTPVFADWAQYTALACFD